MIFRAGDVETVAFGGAVARTKQFECGHVAVGGLGKGGGEESVARHAASTPRGRPCPARRGRSCRAALAGIRKAPSPHVTCCGAGMMPVAGHPAAGARSKGESGKAKRDKRDFFHKVFRSGTTTNRDEPAKPEEGGASRGRSRKRRRRRTASQRQTAAENRRGTGTAGNRNRRQTADRPRQAAIRGGFAARSRDSPKQEYEKSRATRLMPGSHGPCRSISGLIPLGVHHRRVGAAADGIVTMAREVACTILPEPLSLGSQAFMRQ